MAISRLAWTLQHTSPAMLALSAGVFVVTALLVREIWSWYRLRHIPGPFLNSISVFPMVRRAMGGRLNEELKKLGDEYGKRILSWESSCSFAPGPLVRVGPNELMFSDAETFRKLSAIRLKY